VYKFLVFEILKISYLQNRSSIIRGGGYVEKRGFGWEIVDKIGIMDKKVVVEK